MPEGDTVWRTARRLHDALAGRALTRSDFRVPQWATLDLSGVTVDEAVSRGKHLFVRAGDVSLHTHLKMEGAWHVYPPGGRWRRPAHTARVVLENADHQAVGFSLGHRRGARPEQPRTTPWPGSAPICSAPTGRSTRPCAG